MHMEEAEGVGAGEERNGEKQKKKKVKETVEETTGPLGSRVIAMVTLGCGGRVKGPGPEGCRSPPRA